MVGSEETPTDYRSYCATDFTLYEQLVEVLIERGVMTEDDPREPWFMCYSHSAQDIAETLTAFEESVRAVMGFTPARAKNFAMAA
jgi:glutamate-1-semialdehyde aminotransferase